MKKSKKIAKPTGSFGERISAGMKFKELQRANVVRGLSFEEAVRFDFHQHQSWFIKHADNGQDLSLLDMFDLKMKHELLAAGYPEGDPVHHISLRLGYIAESDELDEDGKPKIKKKKVIGKAIKKKEKRVARERLPGTNILAGTKKSYTYELAGKGKTIERTIEKVLERFPDANPSSVRNWYKRALKEKK